jgi:superfamily II DNA or RNA helicase
MEFKELNLGLRYKTNSHDILNEFYEPVLKRSKKYRRAVGFFNSSILKEYVASIKDLVLNGGSIELIISPVVSKEDLETFKKINDNDSNDIIADWLGKLVSVDNKSMTASQILFVLIRSNVLKVKIAVPVNNIGLFHDKIGIFEDKYGNSIVINGSNNETLGGLFLNHESFSVFKSWESGQKEYVSLYTKDFETYWNKDDKNLKIYELNRAIEEKLFREIKDFKDLESLFENLEQENKTEKNINFIPLEFQEKAVEKLLKNKKGIFKFATGSGKTKAAILFMRLVEKDEFRFFVIIVPDKALNNQWKNELSEYYPNVVQCFSDNQEWKNELKDSVEFFLNNKDKSEVVIVTQNTFIGTSFRQTLSKLNNEFIFIADECHNIATEKTLELLPDVEYRLGLSATPENFYSESLTKRLFEYFNGIIYEFSLKEAIQINRLVKYFYYPIIVTLNDDEKNKYLDLTKKIVRKLGYDPDTKKGFITKDAELLLFKRSRLIYSASEKLDFLLENSKKLSKEGKLLIYCGATSKNTSEELKDSNSQLQSVNMILGKLNITHAQYTKDESGEERINSLELFKSGSYKVLTAIKCLDEGIDIPEIERAIILASSTNPREFVQRRGRLLRVNPPHKKFAEIYDLVVIVDEYNFSGLNNRELSRLLEYSSIAENIDNVRSEHSELISKYIKKE